MNTKKKTLSVLTMAATALLFAERFYLLLVKSQAAFCQKL